jgi:hypothetical protein
MPGALDEVARLAREWFERHLTPAGLNSPAMSCAAFSASGRAEAWLIPAGCAIAQIRHPRLA